MKTRPYALFFASALLTACGSTTPHPESQPPAETADASATTTTTTTDAAAASQDAATAAGPHSAWDGVTYADLVRLVREGAAREIHEYDPGFDLARLPEYRAHPESAPELNGHVADQVLRLAGAELAEGHLDEAEQNIRYVRARARNRNSAFAGTTTLAEIARRRAGNDEAAARAGVERVMRELPRERFGASTVVYRLFQAPEQIHARMEQLHQTMLTPETAAAALSNTFLLTPVVENRPLYLAVLDAIQAEYRAAPPLQPYAFGTVDLTDARDAHPVKIAVWDTGTNAALFERQLLTNPGEQPNGQDDDHDGVTDDIHGVASDEPPVPSTVLLYDPGQETVTRYAPFLRGIMDLRAGIADSEAARAVLALEREAHDAASQDALERNLGAISEWGHGTHVAGIMVSGNPHARLAIFRSAWAGEERLYHHRGPTDEELSAERANIDQIAAFINAQGIRVVNASLGFTQEYLEGQLRYESDRYHSEDEVKARARQVLERRRDNWAHAFAACPNTLFVVAAGNDNQDVVEYHDVPASIDAPNVIAVGAVDRYGHWATFTNSNPERVRIFDQGVEVESLIPNGERVPLSGTSMASPNVANLAGKLLALDPTLTPQRLIQVIYDTADPIPAPFNGRIANEAHAVQAVRHGPPAGGHATPGGHGQGHAPAGGHGHAPAGGRGH